MRALELPEIAECLWGLTPMQIDELIEILMNERGETFQHRRARTAAWVAIVFGKVSAAPERLGTLPPTHRPDGAPPPS